MQHAFFETYFVPSVKQQILWHECAKKLYIKPLKRSISGRGWVFFNRFSVSFYYEMNYLNPKSNVTSLCLTKPFIIISYENMHKCLHYLKNINLINYLKMTFSYAARQCYCSQFFNYSNEGLDH